MPEVKRCSQCGMLKSVEEFRKYSYSKKKETEGRYRTCKSCEAINASYSRLKKRVEAFKVIPDNGANKLEYVQLIESLNKIENMYAMLEQRGLRVPSFGARPKVVPEASTLAAVDKLNNFYGSVQSEVCARIDVPVEVPDELTRWLEADMQEWVDAGLSPEYLQETIYESLKAKYRPQTSVDRSTFMPIYDDTYKETLNDILRKFDDYEELMASKEDAYE